jgi:hypothetical protein
MGLFSRDPDDDDADDGGSPFEGRGFILSAIVVGAVVVCGVALLVVTRDRGTPAATPTNSPSAVVTTVPTTEPTGPATPDPTQPSQSGTPRPTTSNGPQPCKLPPNDEGLSEAPAGVSWDFQDGILVPVRDTIGPGITDADGLKHCFHRSPAGAVVAVLTTVAQAQDPRHLTDVVQRRVVPGPGQRLALGEARRLLASPSPDADRNKLGQVQYVGYKFIDYTQTRAILSVAIQVDPDHIGAISLAVRWSGGDWKIDLRSDGQLGPDPDVLASLDGYVRFRGS